MAKTTETTTPATAAAPPQRYRILHTMVGPGHLQGDVVTAEELFPGQDPEFIAERGLPRLLRLEAICRAEDPPGLPNAAAPNPAVRASRDASRAAS